VKTVLDIPDDLAGELERHARRQGRETAEHLLHLVRLAMLVEDLPLATIAQIVRARNALAHAQPKAPVTDTPAQESGIETITSIDPVTGLRVIESPPDAPIHRMTPQEVLDLTNAVLLEQDLEWAGVSVRPLRSGGWTHFLPHSRSRGTCDWSRLTKTSRSSGD